MKTFTALESTKSRVTKEISRYRALEQTRLEFHVWMKSELLQFMEDNLQAQIKSLSKSEGLGGEGLRQWVSTTSHVLTIVIRDSSRSMQS